MKDHVNVCIPTIDRSNLLIKTIESILKGNYENVSFTIIVDDGRLKYYHWIRKNLSQYTNFDIMFNKDRIGWPRSLNKIFGKTDHDYYLYASDDLGFGQNTITKALADMKEHFPDGDGVIGLTQQLGKFCPAAFGLVGRKWINRFPDRRMFYPRYIHFCGDSELWRYSRSIKRFHLSKAAVHHNRPFDNCKKLAQTTLARDRRIWFPRRDSNSFWPLFK